MNCRRSLISGAISSVLVIAMGGFNLAGAIDVHLTGLSRNAAPPGETISIYGQIGPRKEPNEGLKSIDLCRDGERKGTMSPVSWENDNVVAKIPYGLPSGTYEIKISQTTLTNCSNALSFTMRPASVPDIGFDSDGHSRPAVLEIGERRREVVHGEELVVTPDDVSSIQGETYAVDVRYTVREFNGKRTDGFDISYYWKNNRMAGKDPKYVGQVADVRLQPWQVRKFHSTVYMERQERENYSGLFMIELDEDNSIEESMESNNTFKAHFKFGDFDRPDLVVQDIELLSEDPKAGDNILFLVTVKNIGPSSAPASKLGVRIGGSSSVRTFDIPSREPGQAFRQKLNTRRLQNAGRYRITAMADYGGQIPEVRESNNEDFLSFEVGEKVLKRPVRRVPGIR